MNIEQPTVSQEKLARHEIRKKIDSLVFTIGQVVSKDLGLSSIKQGEVQSSDFINRAREIAEDELFWEEAPTLMTGKFSLHGVIYEKGGMKDEVREELRDLIRQHEQIEE